MIMMKNFNQLVNKQMKTMDQLLYLQDELTRCQQVKNKLQSLHDETAKINIQLEIIEMKKELKEIQQLFELQTEQVINEYEELSLEMK